jgi:hypothetical protein
MVKWVGVTAIIIIVDQIVRERGVEESVDIKVMGDDGIVSFVVFPAIRQSVIVEEGPEIARENAYILAGRSFRVSGAR